MVTKGLRSMLGRERRACIQCSWAAFWHLLPGGKESDISVLLDNLPPCAEIALALEAPMEGTKEKA